MKETPAPSTKQTSKPPLSSDAGLYKRIIESIKNLNPASSNFESEFNKVFTQAQKDLGIADEKIISGVASLILQQLPSNNIIADKFKFSELSIKDLENLIKFGMAISIEGQEGSFAPNPHQLISRQINPETGKLVLYPHFIAPYKTHISQGLENAVSCKSADGMKSLKSYIDSITTNSSSEIEKLAEGKFLLPNIAELQKMISALLDPNFRELFEVRRFKDSNCGRPPFSDVGFIQQGLVSPRILGNKIEGRHIVGGGTNIFYVSPFALSFNGVSSHENLHYLFSGHVDENFPQLRPLLDLDSKDIPISIMTKELSMDKWLDNRFGVLDYFFAVIAENQAYKKGGVQEFEKYKNCTEDFIDLLEIYKKYNCSEIKPVSTAELKLTSTSMPAITPSPAPTPESTTPSAKSISTKSEEMIRGNLSDKIMTQVFIESCAIFLGFIAQLALIKIPENDKNKEALVSFTENFSRILAIGILVNKETALQSLALPALISSYKTLEASAQKIGFTPPSEAFKKMIEGAIGGEAQEKIAEIYQNTPEYAKLMAKQLAFVSAIHLLGNLIANDQENRLSLSESLILSATTGLYSSVVRAGFHYLEKKIGNYVRGSSESTSLSGAVEDASIVSSDIAFATASLAGNDRSHEAVVPIQSSEER